MTRESAYAARLHGLIVQLSEARATPEPIFRMIERLAETGGAEEADRTVARFLDCNTDTKSGRSLPDFVSPARAAPERSRFLHHESDPVGIA
ncbi:hypothetical protein [Methylobacterium sp. 17Sr1-1]|uniref:hypothetical protein n=1 Tax=Methylobacterium sp. 17Sr1-1 TaxID=2202826 RepID=UPI0013A558B3|nr:hypothetical protein [Methylobacterium sp. 17Sr1-1]